MAKMSFNLNFELGMQAQANNKGLNLKVDDELLAIN